MKLFHKIPAGWLLLSQIMHILEESVAEIQMDLSNILHVAVDVSDNSKSLLGLQICRQFVRLV